MTTRAHPTWALALCTLLAACGGGGEDTAASTASTPAGSVPTGTAPAASSPTASTPTASTLTISNTNPSGLATTVDLSTATSTTNEARAADSFSSVAYCAVTFNSAAGANGRRYTLQVYFRQTDQLPINLSLTEGFPPNWVVFENRSGAPISGLSVSASARTINFANKVVTADGGLTATLAGTVGFPRHASVGACGA